MKKVQMVFYNTTPLSTNKGMKYVLWQISDKEGNLTHDWGFADWLGDKWDAIETPEGYEAKVVWWANTLQPEQLLVEKSKIISLGGVK